MPDLYPVHPIPKRLGSSGVADPHDQAFSAQVHHAPIVPAHPDHHTHRPPTSAPTTHHEPWDYVA
ncbi:MAG TPA: hypothetical protein VHQ68_10695 [Propionibacteriaceae bacterium]|nr:hypothetical protein [Propionibacteriaceae bacterium]